MSKFSEYLRQMIKKSGESVSAVSRSIGAERTSIHKALADERILSYKVVQNLARHFNLTIDERNEFSGFITFFCKAKIIFVTEKLSVIC